MTGFKAVHPELQGLLDKLLGVMGELESVLVLMKESPELAKILNPILIIVENRLYSALYRLSKQLFFAYRAVLHKHDFFDEREIVVDTFVQWNRANIDQLIDGIVELRIHENGEKELLTYATEEWKVIIPAEEDTPVVRTVRWRPIVTQYP